MNKNLKKTIKFLKKNRGLVLKTIIPVVIFCVTVIIISILLPKPNDNISPSSNGYLYENRNPTFNVGFGSKENLSKQYVRFEAKVADNPFEEKEENFWSSFTKSFKSKKGFEFGLSEVRFSETQSDTGEKLLEQMGTAIEQMELDSISTDTEVIDVGRLLGEEDSDNVSKKTVINKDVYPGIDVEYQILEGLGVKEEIVIRNIDEYTSECGSDSECLLPLNEFIFDLKLDEGLVIKESMVVLRGKTENKYYVTDEEDNYIAHFLPTFAVDESGAKTTDVDLDISHVEGRDYKVTVILNLEWLFSKDRVFPIRIDPSIVHDTTTEFDTGSDYNTEVVTGPQIKLEGPEANETDSSLKGYWKFDDEVKSVIPERTTGMSNNLSGYWDFVEPSGSGAYLLDKSWHTNNATPSGTTSTTGKIGNGRSFNGTSDYISVAHDSSLSFDRTNSYTLEAWIKTSSTATQRIMAKLNAASPYTGYDIAIVNSKIRTHLIGSWSTSAIQVDGSTTVTDGKWHHIVVTYDGSSSASGMKIYVDGTLETPTVGNNNLTTSTTNTTPFTIGLRNGGSDHFNGLIDEVAVYQYDLSSSEVLTRYREGLDIKDSSANNNHGTGYGTTYVNNGKVDTALQFDGDASGDHVNVGPVSNFGGTTAFTVSAWVYAESAPTTQGRTAVSTYHYISESENYGWNFGAVWTAHQFGFHLGGGGNATNINDPTFFSENLKEWVHYVGVYSASNYMKLYKNGELVAETTTNVPSSISYYTGTDLIIGRRSLYNGSYWDGSIDEVRVYNTAISEDEIERLYSLGIEEKVSGAHTSASLDTEGSSSDIESITWTSVGDDTGDGETPYSTTNLVAQWDFNESSGTTADNEGSLGATCDGTLTNMTTSGQDAGMGTGWTSDKRRWGNGALMFDGDNDYVSVPSHSSLRPSMGFSVEAWVNTDEIGEVQQIITSSDNGGGDDGWGLRIQGSGRAAFNGSNASGWYPNVIESDTIVKPGEWYYLVGIYTTDDAFGQAELKIYVNGVLENIKTVSGGVVYSVTDYINIGRRGGTYDPNSLFFDGVIDSIRFYGRQLSASEILSNYQSGNIEMRYRTSSDGSTWTDWSGSETSIDDIEYDSYLYSGYNDDTSCKGYWHMDTDPGSNVDDSKNYHDGTAYGSTVVDGQYDYARSFDGVNDYIEIPNHTDLQLSSNFSWSAWIYRAKDTGGWERIMAKSDSSGWDYFMQITNADTLHCGVYTTNSNVNQRQSLVDIPAGEWTHVACELTSSYTWNVYVNGNLSNGTTSSSPYEPARTSTKNLQLGRLGDSSTWYYTFTGSIDEFAIHSPGLTASEVSDAWREGSSKGYVLKSRSTRNSTFNSDNNYEISSPGYSAVDGATAGYWKLDETSGSGAYLKDSTPNNNDGTPSGTTFTANGKAGGAREFNGSSDYISVPSSSSLNITGDLTVETWIYTHDSLGSANNQRWLEKGDGYFLMEGDGDNFVGTGITFLVKSSNTNYYVDSGISHPANQWYYVVGVHDDSANLLKLYVNGVLINTTSFSSTIDNDNLALRLGSDDAGKYFDGLLDEVRISNVARTDEQIAESYSFGKNHYVSRSIASTDISSDSVLPFWIASDQLGSNFSVTYGESSYANYESDANTVGLWGMQDGAASYPAKDCSVLRSYGITSSGVYTIDPDGPGGSSAFNAYCNMTYDGGGWTLLDNFVSSLAGDSDPYGAAIGDSDIRNGTDLTNAGYTTYLTNFEHTSYTRQAGYLQMFYSGAPVGYMEKTLPSYADEVYVKWGNWYTGTAALKIGGATVQSLSSSYGAATYQGAYSSGDAIRMEENGIFWAGEIWVRDSDADKYVSIEDRSGNLNDGVSMGAISGDGVIGDGRKFDGVDDYIEITDSSDYNFERTNSFTIEAWIKTSSDNLFQEIVGKMNNAAPYRGYDISVYDGNIHFMLINTWDTNCIALYGQSLVNDGNWHHIVATYDGSSSASGAKVYIDGKRESVSVSKNSLSATIQHSDPLTIGTRNHQDSSYFDGSIDEVRISNVVRSADDIRQTYEVGKRTHPITVDFKADLQSSNLITSTSDKSFTISEQDYGATDHIENIDVGETIVIKENVGGSDYRIYGEVDSINSSTGAVTVDSWTTDGFFPTGGYTVNATVFKFQKEYIDIRYPLDEDINAITRLTYRKTTDVPAFLWIDDVQKATYSSDYDASSFTPIEGIRYIQYKPVFTKWDSNPNLDLYLTEVDIEYTSGPTNEELMRHGKWFNTSGIEQPFWWVGNESSHKEYYTITFSDWTPTCGFPVQFGVTSSTVVEGGNASPELSCSGSGTFCGFQITSGACTGTFSSTTGSCSEVWQDITIEGGYYPSSCPW